jgi:hypothetical protein
MVMTSSEGIPLWDSVSHPCANALDYAFGCGHARLSRVFTLGGRTYKVGCDGGARFRYSRRTMSIVRPHRHFLPG